MAPFSKEILLILKKFQSQILCELIARECSTVVYVYIGTEWIHREQTVEEVLIEVVVTLGTKEEGERRMGREEEKAKYKIALNQHSF